MKNKKRSPWKSGNAPWTIMFGFNGLFLAVCFFGFVLFDQTDNVALMALAAGVGISVLCFFLGVINWITEKKVNKKLVFLEYVNQLKTDFNTIDDPADPLISLYYNSNYVSRNNDDVYTVSLEPVYFGTFLYIFRNPKNHKTNFCVVYNKVSFANHKFVAFERQAPK